MDNPITKDLELYTVPALEYGQCLLDLESDYSNLTKEDMDQLRYYGFNFQYDRKTDLWKITGDYNSKVKLLREELEAWILDNDYFHELRDYAELKWWSDSIADCEILEAYQEAMKEAEQEREYKVTVQRVINYMHEYYKLNEFEKVELNAQRADDYLEKKHPDAR